MYGEVFIPLSLHPGETPSVFVEVAFKRSITKVISLQCAVRPLIESDNRYRLRIVAKSRNAHEVNAWFLMSVDGRGVLNFVPNTGTSEQNIEGRG
jgi:hypothetical protein